MYWDYCRERLGLEVTESSEGFVLWKAYPDYLYIQDIYVLPEHRQLGAGKAFLSKLEAAAKAQGLKRIVGSCVPTAYGSTQSLRVLLKCGFELQSSDKDIVYFSKEIGGN